MNSAKANNRWLLAGALVLLGMLLWFGLTGEVLALDIGLPRLFRAAPWVVAAMLLSLTIQSLVPRSAKEVMVFHAIGRRLPSYQAFGKYTLNDPRIDEEILVAHHGDLPTDPQDQHRLWYRIYQAQNEKPAVTEALGRYLLFRDLCAVLVVFLVASTVILAAAIPGAWPERAYFVPTITASCYLVCAYTAQSAAKDLCQNVLALASANDSTEKE